MAKPMSLFLLLLFFLCFFPTTEALYNVLDFGAKTDGRTDSAQSFLRAWASACGSSQPTTIHVPAGRFLLSRAVFRGPCKNTAIKFLIDGTIAAPSNYANLGSSGQWIEFDNVMGVSIYGGNLDGQGGALWACKSAGRSCPKGATSLTFNNAKNVEISGLSSINSEFYHIMIKGCRGVKIHDVSIIAPGTSPNTDGIHVTSSTDVTITGTTIKTGDDCISIGPGTANIWVEQLFCGPGHGISIGSLGWNLQEEGVKNITVNRVIFSGTQNGLRIKTWGRPSHGYVEGIVFQHAVMRNVQNPMIIDQNYCPHKQDCPGQSSGVRISQVKFRDIRGSSATPVAVKFDCSPSNPCNGIGLKDIELTYGNQPAQSSCRYAYGTASGLSKPPSCL